MSAYTTVSDRQRDAAGRVAAAVSASRIEESVCLLAATPRHSTENPREHARAADYIADVLSGRGVAVSRQAFPIDGQSAPRTGVNVIGTLTGRGARGPAVLIGAHYDTVVDSPGADDNASGVAAVLECARVLSGLELRRPVIFAAFDAEEKQPPVEGLHGSTAYVASLVAAGGRPVDSVGVAYIMEMIGFASPPGTQSLAPGFQILFPRAFDGLRARQFAGDSVVALANPASTREARMLERASDTFGGGTPILALEIPWWLSGLNDFYRSDHAPFWRVGIPALMIGDTANYRNPHYHTPGDTALTLDFQMAANVTKTLAASMALQVAAY